MDERLATLAQKHNILLGTSSWKYDGWKGLVYGRDYPSQKSFNETCLGEYAEHYPIVGIDHTFYTWPLPSTLDKYVRLTPPQFKFGLKATEIVTIFRYPKIKRYGKNAGKENPAFLDSGLFCENFLEVIRPYRSRIAVIMFEFSRFRAGTLSSGREFVAKLDRFLSGLPTQEFPFAIEIRNQNWLESPYFDVLSKHQVSHVFNSWTAMPAISEQLRKAMHFRPSSYPARLLLKPGRPYENAVKKFSPYRELQEELPELRSATAQLVQRAIAEGVPAYVFVNNRAEGCAPETIRGILERL